MPRAARAACAALLLLASCDKLGRFFAGDPTPAEQAKAHLQKAHQAEVKGDDRVAIAEYEAARAALDNDPVSAAALGRLYERQGNLTAAILSDKRAAELSGDPEPRKRLADLYLRQGRADLAAAALQGLAGPDDLDAQLKLARTLLLSGQPDQALDQADKTLAAHPGDADALSAKAEALLAQGHPDQAAQLLDAAVAGNPTSVEVRMARARFLSQRNLHDKALVELERIEASQSERPEVIAAKARELALLNRFDEAAKVVGDYVARHPGDVEGSSTLAWVKLRAGDVEGARDAAEGVIARRPGDARALYVRGRCLESDGDLARAIAAYRAALEAEPGQVDSLQRLWRLQEKQGQVTDAIVALERLYLLRLAAPEEEIELARLYAETGLHGRRGLALLDDVAKQVPETEAVAGIRKKLAANAATDRRAAGNGVQILRGGR